MNKRQRKKQQKRSDEVFERLMKSFNEAYIQMKIYGTSYYIGKSDIWKVNPIRESQAIYGEDDEQQD